MRFDDDDDDDMTTTTMATRKVRKTTKTTIMTTSTMTEGLNKKSFYSLFLKTNFINKMHFSVVSAIIRRP